MFAHPYACQSETNTIRNRVARGLDNFETVMHTLVSVRYGPQIPIRKAN